MHANPHARAIRRILAVYLAIQYLVVLVWLAVQGVPVLAVLAMAPLLAAGHCVFGTLLFLVLTADERSATEAAADREPTSLHPIHPPRTRAA